MNTTSTSVPHRNSVIPTVVRPSVFGWSNAVEEPAVRSLRQTAVLIFLAALLSGVAVAQDLPKGWRRPTKAETSDDWRNKSRTRFLAVNGDFDGDGTPDIAELVVNRSNNQFGVFVRLASTGLWQELVRGDLKSLPNVGVSSARRGTYKTACGKGYGDYACANGEPNSLEIRGAAIDVFYEESSDTVYYWDQKSKKFIGVLMSD